MDRESQLARLTDAECEALLSDWKFWARPKQLAPEGDWLYWLLLSGRGFGKTRTAAEFVRERMNSGEVSQATLIGETAADVRDLMVEGPAGLLKISPPDERPQYNPSKRRLTWPNGSYAVCYSGEDPDSIRGGEVSLVWCDEFAKWKYPKAAWDQLQFTLRALGDLKIVITTTPRPLSVLKQIKENPRTHLTTGSSYENRANLNPAYYSEVIEPYENTRLGRQEIHGHLLEDIPGALWSRQMVENSRVSKAPDMERVVLSIDPAVTSGEDSDETGIVVAGKGVDGRAYVLADRTCRLSPDGWAKRAVSAFEEFEADRVTAEVNNGGDLVERVIRTVSPRIPYRAVHASRGKRVRAEPVAALYEQRKVAHVGGFPELEDQMCFTGETLVRADGILGASCRSYSGPLVVVETERGCMEMTPNHPVLTNDGWVEAKDLQDGLVVWYNRPHGTEALHSARIGDVFEALSRRGQVFARSFEIDGTLGEVAFGHGEEPRTTPDLRPEAQDEADEFEAHRAGLHRRVDRRGWLGSVSAQQAATLRKAERTHFHHDETACGLADRTIPLQGCVRSQKQGSERAGCVLLPVSGHGVSQSLRGIDSISGYQEAANGVDSSVGARTPQATNSVATDSEVLGDCRSGRYAEPVKVTNVRRREVRSLSVYNLHTVSSWYLADNHIVHNCSFVPEGYDGSPDRVDALVWSLTELMLTRKEAEVFSF